MFLKWHSHTNTTQTERQEHTTTLPRETKANL